MKQFFLERRRFFCLLAPALFGLVYLFLCVTHLEQSVNLSESQNVYMTRFGAFEAIKNAPQSTNLPFYYLILKIIGRDIYSLRLLSAVLGAAAIFFIFKWTKYKYGAKAAILGALFVSICPFMIHSGQSIQANTLIILEAFASLYFLQLAIDTKEKKWWVVYVIILSLGLWAHLSFVLIWLVQLIYVASIYKKEFFDRKLFLLFVVPIFAFLPCVFMLNFSSVSETSLNTLTETLAEMVLYSSANETKALSLLLLLAGIVSLTYLLIKTKKKAVAPVLLIAMPVSLLAVLSIIIPAISFSSENLAVVPVSICLLIAISLAAQMNKRVKKNYQSRKNLRIIICSVIFVSISALGIYNVFEKGSFDFESNSRPAVSLLYKNIEALSYGKEAIVTSSEELYFELSAYETSVHPVYLLGDSKIANRIDSIEDMNNFWFVSMNEDALPDNDLEVVEEATLNLDKYSPSYSLRKLSAK